MVTSPSRARDLSALRPSASLVVVNSSNEVLLVHRNPNATSFAGMHVFPGGNYDEKQDDSFQMTAIRETFEETGLLLASESEYELPRSQSRWSPLSPPPSLSEADLDASRELVHTGKTLFRDFLKQHALTADVKALLPFTEWITPLGYSRRFHTRFYVAFLPSHLPSTFTSTSTSTSSCSFPSSQASSGVHHHHHHHHLHRLPTPTPDGGQEGDEVVEARFVHPQEALAEHRSKKIALMPPQHYILATLTDLLVGRQTTPWQRERVGRLSAGSFGRMVVCPRVGKRDANGRTSLVYEGDEARGGPSGRLHRSVVLFSPETKLPTEVELLRNFDIFTQVESGATTASTKL